jgi:hypothetical protein
LHQPADAIDDRQKIKDEVWEQLRLSLNDDPGVDLMDSNLAHWYFDDSIVTGGPSGKPENREPLLVNTVGSWARPPEAHTGIPNLYLASDFVRTYTDLATMEGANEAARRAVNAILESRPQQRETVQAVPTRGAVGVRAAQAARQNSLPPRPAPGRRPGPRSLIRRSS